MKSIKELQGLVEDLNAANCYVTDVYDYFHTEISLIYCRNKIQVANVLSNLSSLSISKDFGRYYAATQPNEDGNYFPEEITEELYEALLKFSRDNPFAKTFNNK